MLDQLDAYKHLIYELYLKQDLPLSDVEGRLYEIYGIHTSTHNIRAWLEKQEYTKVLPRLHWAYIARQLEWRSVNGIRSQVIVNGRTLSDEMCNAEIARQYLQDHPGFVLLKRQASSKPANVTIYTPRRRTYEPQCPEPLPWHYFMRSVETQVFGNKGLVSTTSLPDPPLPRGVVTIPIDSIRWTISAKRMLSYLSVFVIEDNEPRQHSVAEHVALIFRNKTNLRVFHLLRYLVFLLSNNIPNSRETRLIVPWALTSDYPDIMQELAVLPGPTAAILRSRLLWYAIETENPNCLRKVLHLPAKAGFVGKSAVDFVTDALLQHALRKGNHEMVTILLQAGGSYGKVFNVSAGLPRCSPPALLRLLKFDANLGDGSGMSILRLSGVPDGEYCEILDTLLQSGMDPNMWVRLADSGTFMTPLQIAICQHRGASVIKRLLKSGARLEGPSTEDLLDASSPLSRKGCDKEGVELWTPMDLAAWSGQIAIMQLLKEAGANPDSSRKYAGDDRNNLNPRWPHQLRNFPLGLLRTSLDVTVAFDQMDGFKKLLDLSVPLSPDGIYRIFQLALHTCDKRFLQILHGRPGTGGELTNYFLRQFEAQRRDNHGLFNAPMPQELPVLTALSSPEGAPPINLLSQLALVSMWQNALPCDGTCEVDLVTRHLVDNSCAGTYKYPIEGSVHLCTAEMIFRCVDKNSSLIGSVDMSVWNTALNLLHEGKFCAAAAVLGYSSATQKMLHQRRLQTPDGTKMLEAIRHLPSLKHDINTIIARRREQSLTPLEVAINCRDLELAKILLSYEADPNVSGGVVRPLERACKRLQLDTAMLLAERGATVKGVSSSSNCWSVAIIGAKHPENGPKILDIVERLQSAGMDVDAAFVLTQDHLSRILKKGDRCTLLQWLSQGQNNRDAERLLTMGAKINCLNQTMYTALQVATLAGSDELVNIYIEHGADVNAPPHKHYGRTALQAAAQQGHSRLMTRLLDAEAQVNAAPSPHGGLTALQAAAKGGYLPAAELLIQRGAYVAGPRASEGGRTALQAAAENGRLDMLQLLLNNYDAPDWKRACVDAASYAESQHPIIAKFLREYHRE